MSDEPTSIWVRSDVLPDGAYVCTVDFTPDLAVTLTPERALRYVAAVTSAVTAAEYDAAVARQITAKLGLSIGAAASVVAALRADRPPVDQAALDPLVVDPAVHAVTGKPFLKCWAGDLRWQWTPAEAMHHAMAVLTVSSGVDLDAAYRRYLLASVGLDQSHAMAMVEDVAQWRHPRADTGGS